MINKLLRVWFNSIEITKYLVVTDLQRGIGTTRNNNTLKNDTRDFEEYSGHTLGMKPIDMGFALIEDVIEKRRELADIFNVSKPAPLVFSDEPDVYYLAVPTGDIDFDDKKHYGEGTIFWLVPDGVAHAVDPKEFSNVNKEPVVIKSDFAGKEAGSLVECPHSARITYYNNLVKPDDKGNHIYDFATDAYKDISKLDNKHFSRFIGDNDKMTQILISYDILSTVKRAYPFLFEGLSESEQVEKLKKMATKVVTRFHVMGSGPNGNSLTRQWYDNPQKKWGVPVRIETPKITEVEINFTQPWFNYSLNDKGCQDVLINADASDGTTPSSVSLDYTNVEITLKLPNGNVVTIVNDGSYPTYPILEATIKGDNGLVSFINDNGGVLQFGNPDEIDGYDYQTSDHVIWEPMQKQGEWEVNKGQIVYPNYLYNPETPNVIAGDIDWTSVYEMAAPIFEDPLPVWNGPTIRRSIPKNSNNQNTGNFSYKARFRFATTVQAIGRFHFQLQNETAIPFAVVIRDSVGNRKEIVVEIWFNEEIVYQEPMSTAKFNSDFFEVKLERFGTEFKTTFSQISKIVGSKIYYAQTYFKSIDLQEVSGIPVTHITQWVARYSTRAMPIFEYTDTKFTWINVDKWQELPNRFMDGDVLRVDTSSGEILLNNVPEPSLMTRGNQWGKFELEKGQHNILVVQSSWAEVPDVKGIIREAHL